MHALHVRTMRMYVINVWHMTLIGHAAWYVCMTVSPSTSATCALAAESGRSYQCRHAKFMIMYVRHFDNDT